MAFLQSKCTRYYLSVLSPTLNLQAGEIRNLPLLYINSEKITYFVQDCVTISKSDWDAHETSWDFQRNELLSIDTSTYTENLDYKIEKHFEETGEHISISLLPQSSAVWNGAWSNTRRSGSASSCSCIRTRKSSTASSSTSMVCKMS